MLGSASDVESAKLWPPLLSLTLDLPGLVVLVGWVDSRPVNQDLMQFL